MNSESTGIVNNYWGNYDNEKFIGLKRSLNLYSLYSSGLLEELEEFYMNPKCIVLFGSYSRGEDTNESDIDIAVISSKEDMPDIGKYENALNRKISIHIIKSIKSEDNNFINTLVNGIVLSGYLDVV